MLDKLTTLTGVPAGEIAHQLSLPFNDPKAYKGVPGGADLTDINTGFMLERATAVFGPRGLGWTLTYASTDLEVLNLLDKRPTAHLKNALFRYLLVGTEGQQVWSEIQTSGASTNELAYAPEGARTAAIGSALKALCFQLPVYKGELDHHNAARVIGESQPPEPAQPKGRPAPSQPAPNGHGGHPVPPAPQPVPAVAGDDPASFVIPLGKNQGLTLGAVNPKAIEWYATQMQPATPEAVALQAAARRLLEAVPV